jgi:hypothetical protein
MEQRPRILPDTIRSRGIMVWGSPGAGKSVLLGRVIAWQDFYLNHPVFVIDPIGTVTDYFLTKISIPDERIVYADMSGLSGYVVPFPLCHLNGKEQLFEASQLFPSVVRNTDPSIMIAPVQGAPPLFEISTHVIMILTALKLSIIHAKSILQNPEAWAEKFAEAVANHPECQHSVDFFLKVYKQLSQDRKTSITTLFRQKITPFYSSPTLQAICAATQPGIDWQDVIEKKKIVLLDFRSVTSEQIKSFLTLWCLKSFLTFIRLRGRQREPIVLMIDELKALFMDPHSQNGDSAFSNELIELIDIYARNYNLWSVFSVQDANSFGEQSKQSLLGMGTHIIGKVNNTAAAEVLSKALFIHDPMKIKDPSAVRSQTYFSLAESISLTAQKIQSLEPLHFLVRSLVSGSKIYPIRIDTIDRGLWPDSETLGHIRQKLAERSGSPIQDVITEIAQQPTPVIPPQEEKPKRSIKHEKRDPLPPPTKKVTGDDIY